MLLRRVVGTSMSPGLCPGDVVVARRKRSPKVNQVVIARLGGRDVIKRIDHLTGSGEAFLVGDNPAASTDSRQLGVVPSSAILGVVTMKIQPATAIPAPRPIRPGLVWVPYALAALTCVMLLTQLLSFEKFVPVIGTYFLPGGDMTAKLTSAAIVLSELFALPFWLQMRLSPLARLCSLLSGFVFAAIWLKLAVWALAQGLTLDNIGYFGAFLPWPSGWWMLLVGTLLMGMAVWSASILNARQVIRLKGLRAA